MAGALPGERVRVTPADEGKVPVADAVLYLLRHTHATDLVRRGVPARRIAGKLVTTVFDLLLGEQDSFDARRKFRRHTLTVRSAKPYLKIRFSKSF